MSLSSVLRRLMSEPRPLQVAVRLFLLCKGMQQHSHVEGQRRSFPVRSALKRLRTQIQILTMPQVIRWIANT